MKLKNPLKKKQAEIIESPIEQGVESSPAIPEPLLAVPMGLLQATVNFIEKLPTFSAGDAHVILGGLTQRFRIVQETAPVEAPIESPINE